MPHVISRHLENIVEPLCDATAKLLTELKNLEPQDHVYISVEDDVYDEHDETATTISTKRFVCKLRSNVPDRTASYWLRSGWWQRIPGHRRADVGGYGFTCPPTDTSALVILAAVGKERLVFEDETAKLEFWTAILRFAKQEKLTKGPAGFKQFRTVPSDAPMGNPEYPPMPAQRVAAWAARQSEAYAFWMEQSTGKTYAAIMSIEESLEPGKCQFIALVCPKNVRAQWQREIARFASKQVRVIRLVGTDIDRKELLLEAFKAKLSGDYDYVVVIVSYQLLVNSVTAICAYPWDWAITDEGHFIKAHKAKRTKAALKLRDHAKRRLTLTGTPIANYLFDLYTQLEFLGRGWSGFTSFDAFKKFYANCIPSGRGLERILSFRNLPLLQERLARLAFMLKKSEALPDLPSKAYDIIEVDMSEEQWDVYKALATQLYAEIERDVAASESGSKFITVNNILTKLLRLSQITSGFVVLDGEIDSETGLMDKANRIIDRFDPNQKLEELVNFIKDQQVSSPQSKIIVWCCYVQSIKTITSRLELEGIRCAAYYGSTSEDERGRIESDWNTDPDLRVIVGNPSAGGVGLNLQGFCPMNGSNDVDETYTRADIVCFYDQNWSSTNRSQGEERPRGFVHESVTPDGKRHHWQVRCVDFIVLGTIDEQIRARVTDKRLHALRIQDVREILGTILKGVKSTKNERS